MDAKTSAAPTSSSVFVRVRITMSSDAAWTSASASASSSRNEKRSEEHTSELQSQSNLVCRLLLEKKNKTSYSMTVPPRHHISHYTFSFDLCFHIVSSSPILGRRSKHSLVCFSNLSNCFPTSQNSI